MNAQQVIGLWSGILDTLLGINALRYGMELSSSPKLELDLRRLPNLGSVGKLAASNSGYR